MSYGTIKFGKPYWALICDECGNVNGVRSRTNPTKRALGDLCALSHCCDCGCTWKYRDSFAPTDPGMAYLLKINKQEERFEKVEFYD